MIVGPAGVRAFWSGREGVLERPITHAHQQRRHFVTAASVGNAAGDRANERCQPSLQGVVSVGSEK
jgi:hypothetical protein